MTPAGFPHSEIPGSEVVCTSPRLIAAYHVLHRLLAPRHPPCALISLTGKPYRPLVLDESAHARTHETSRAPRTRAYPIRKSSVVKDLLRSDPPPGEWNEFKSKKQSGLLGGDNRDRTGNLRLAKPALSQLSYIPKTVSCSLAA